MKRQFFRLTIWLCLLLLCAPVPGPMGAGRAAALETPNGAPVVRPTAPLTLAEDTAVTFALVALDPEQSELTFAVATAPVHGNLQLLPRPCNVPGPHNCVTMATYTPAPNTYGPDSFTYTVSDGVNTSAPATVSLNVTPVNDPPSAVRLQVAAYRGLPLVVRLEGRDIDGDRLTFAVSEVAGGRVAPLPEPVCEGAPLQVCSVLVGFEPDGSSPDRAGFVYTVSDGQAASRPAQVEIQYSDVPPAVPTQQESTPEDTAREIQLRAADPDSPALTYTWLSRPAHGTLGALPAPACTPDGSGGTTCTATVRYMPDPQYFGADSFYFQTSDGTTSVLHRVEVTVTPAADPPVLQVPGTVTVAQLKTMLFRLTATDPDGPTDALTYSLVNAPEGVVVNPATGEVTWTPGANVAPGEYTFAGKVTDSSTPPLSDEKPVKVNVTERDASLVASTVTATPASLDADGISTATVLVTLRDAAGEALTRSHGVVTLTTTAGTLSPVTDHQNGTYSATLTAATAGGTAKVQAWLAGQQLANAADVAMRGLPSPYGTAYGLITAPWGAPLPNLAVELKGQTVQIALTGTTDANGYYRFESLPPGTYTVLVPTYDATHPSASGSVAVTASAQTRLDLQVTSRGSLAVEASPAVIAADRTTSARINVQVRRFYGEILRGADLRYETTGGTLSQTTGSSNQSGNASVTLTAPQTNAGGFSTVEVRVYARSDRDGLFVMKTVPVRISPVSVEGVALDARTGRPIAGAIAEIREDLNGDRTVDFVSQVTTGADGRYRFAVPEVNRVYQIRLSIPVTVESNTLWIPATQVVRVPSNPGPTVYADRQIAGQVLLRDGRTGGLRAPERPESLLGTVLVSNQFREDVPVFADGSFALEGAREGTHRILFRHVLGIGTEMAGVVVQASVAQAGALAVSLPIIDPYAVVRDTDNHPLSGVTLELYWADTYRNRQAGRTPNTLVTLPVLTDLDTRWDSVPQVSASNGRYGWMLYANADYYIKARKNGYEAYDSRTSRRYVLSTTGTDSTVSNGILSVGSALAKLDLTLRPLSEIEPAAPTSLRARTEPGKVVLNWQSVAGAESYTVYRAPANGGSFVPVVRGLHSTSFVDNGVTPGATYVYRVAAAGNSVEGQASTSISIKAQETDPPAPAPEPETPTPEPPAPPAPEPEMPPAPATPPPAPALVHRGYIMGYPDGTFQPDRSISRAEVAAVLARVLEADGQAAGLAPHTDVPAGHWANLYIAIVAQRGLMRGDPDGRFRPDDPITRAEVATIAARLKNLAPESDAVFTDIDGHWAAGWIGAAYREGYVRGYPDGDFRPEVAISRAEFVTVVNRLQGRGPLVGRPTAKWPDVSAGHWAHGQVEEASVSHEADAPLSETGGEIWRKDTN